MIALVNHRRPVTVAWHRSKGPTFLAHFVNNARDPAHLIPFEVEGITREKMIQRMAEVLTQQGSQELQQVIPASILTRLWDSSAVLTTCTNLLNSLKIHPMQAD